MPLSTTWRKGCCQAIYLCWGHQESLCGALQWWERKCPGKLDWKRTMRKKISTVSRIMWSQALPTQEYVCLASRDSLIPGSNLFSLSSRKWQSFLKSCFLACFFSLLVQDMVLKRAKRGKWGGIRGGVSLHTLLATQICTIMRGGRGRVLEDEAALRNWRQDWQWHCHFHNEKTRNYGITAKYAEPSLSFN